MPDRVKPSRLELRLEAEIGVAHSVPEADCKRAELAAYRTRLGRVEEVRATLKELHQRYDARPNVAISAWLNLVEGLARYFSDMDPAARDKVLRAHALSSAAGLTPMRALSAAWLAHLDYAQGDVDSMALHVSEALNLSVETNHGARSRASLVVAQSYHLAGDLDTALPWYVKARDHAQTDGDDATISALMHNMAWLRSHELRKRFFLELENDSATEHALLSAESTRNFNILIGSVSLNSLIPVLRAQILAVIGREAEALVISRRFDSLTCASSRRSFGVVRWNGPVRWGDQTWYPVKFSRSRRWQAHCWWRRATPQHPGLHRPTRARWRTRSSRTWTN